MKIGMKEVAGMNGAAATGQNHLMRVTDITPDIGTIRNTDMYGDKDAGTNNILTYNIIKKENAVLSILFFYVYYNY
jgi:hypothetical protein